MLNMKNRSKILIGISFGQGGAIEGCEEFAEYMIENSRFDFAKELIKNDDVFFENNNHLKNQQKVVEINKRAYLKIKEIVNKDTLPIIVGGDHSVSAGGIMALSEIYADLGVIWIDAHADFNDDKITNSKNMHGMTLSSVCGLGPDCMIDYSENKIIDKNKIVIIGCRDIEKDEEKKLNIHGIRYYPFDIIKKRGLKSILADVKNYLSDKVKNIHLSFDIDSVSPAFAPGTGTPVNGGFEEEEVIVLIRSLKQMLNIVSYDIVEVNPKLDEGDKTKILAEKIIKVFLENN